MTAGNRRRAEELFQIAADLPAEQHQVFVDEQCGDDNALRAELERLLRALGDEGEDLLAEPAMAVTGPIEPGAGTGDRIGHYTIRRVIGTGGMGVVYEAMQEQPHRIVALKVMKPGIASQSALRRFEHESQILARLRHPAIAQVYEAGTHHIGEEILPYFAMEYIPNAKTLIEYANEKKLGIHQRLELFKEVCDAVHHGHQKGIIHRDLKPGNILIDSAGQPKIIDLGVARATDSDMAATTLQTDVGQLMGTLQYMSPEQCEADPHDLDTRSDVYALGVVLYELLCGQLPYDLHHVAIHEAARVIREERPPHPSTINKTLRGDVETITLKSLEKDRAQRYQTASALAEDIGRYLCNEPIVARPPSVWYQFAKFTKRNKAVVVGAAAVFVALVAGTVVAIGFGLSEAEQRQKATDNLALAQQRADELDTVTKFQQSMLSEIDAELMGRSIVEDLRDRAEERLGERGIDEDAAGAALAGFDESVRGVNATNLALKLVDERILSRAIETIEQEFADQPSVRASLQQTVADTYRAIGLYEPATPLQEAALGTRRDELGNDHPDTLESIAHMGLLLKSQGKLTEAEPYYHEALEGSRRVLGDDHCGTLISIGNMGELLRSQGKLTEAEPYYREALEGFRRVLGDDHPETLKSINNMGVLLESQGKLDEAEPYRREALEGARRVLGDDHPQTLTSINNLGVLLREQGKFAEAEPYYREALEGLRRVLGDDHRNTLTSMNNMGVLLQSQGKLAEAEPYFREALESRRRLLGDEHHNTLGSLNNMGGLLRAQGKLAEAEPYYREALEGARRVLGDNHRGTMICKSNLALLLVDLGNAVEAEQLAREAVVAARETLGAEHWFHGNFLGRHGRALAALARFDNAESALLEAHGILQTALGDEREQTKRVVGYLADLYDAWGKSEKAAEWRAKLPTEQDAVASDPPADEKQEE